MSPELLRAKNAEKARRSYHRHRAKHLERMAEYRSVHRAEQNERQYRWRCTPRGRAQVLFLSALKRATSKGIEFTITQEWIQERIERGCCELTGMAFVLGRRPKGSRNHPLAPSLDRINPAAGYTPENCRVITTQANFAMNEWGVHALLALADAIRNHQKESQTMSEQSAQYAEQKADETFKGEGVDVRKAAQLDPAADAETRKEVTKND